ncbi:hypothetical protein HID58_093997 [Brassica napus]|uniref:Uncharacterized protein n=1 Tax=Brassica napus TaxID=3708 RepID=A0ABQ7X940_BRANA|nr:hypothetical protein HID58_093997 [Brassica napus]
MTDVERNWQIIHKRPTRRNKGANLEDIKKMTNFMMLFI